MKTPARASLLSMVLLAGCGGSAPPGGGGGATGGYAGQASGGGGASGACSGDAGIVPDGSQVIEMSGATVADALADIEGLHVGSLTWAVGPDVTASVANGDRTSLKLDVVPDPQQLRYIGPGADAAACAGALTIGSTVRFATGDGSLDETIPVTWGSDGQSPGAFSVQLDLSKLAGTLKITPTSPTFTVSTLVLAGTCAAGTCSGILDVAEDSNGGAGGVAIAAIWSAVGVTGEDGGSDGGQTSVDAAAGDADAAGSDL